MSIYNAYWATLTSPGGGDPNSASVRLRFPKPVDLTAQAAINGIGTGDTVHYRFGFTSYVESGHHQTIPLPVGVFWGVVTELQIEAWATEGWVQGSAAAYLWT